MRIFNPDLLAEFRRKPCEWCGLTPAEPHHWHARGIGDGSRLDIRENLISLCRPCHNKIHSGNLRRYVLLNYIAAREGTTPEQIIQRINYLLRLPKDAHYPIDTLDQRQERGAGLPSDQPAPRSASSDTSLADDQGWVEF